MDDRECSFEGCNKVRRAHGLCQGHNRQRALGKDLTPLQRKGVQRPASACAAPECSRVALSKGLCQSHYVMQRRTGVLVPLRPFNGSVEAAPCVFGPCDRSASAKGLCDGHYLQQFEGRPLSIIRTAIDHAADFHRRVNELGGRVVGDYINAKTPVRCVCLEGHDCAPQPSDVTSGQGICRVCAGKVWDAFYVVTDGRTIKFGITSGDPAPRLANHRAGGLTSVLRLSVGMPPNAAPWLESQCLTVLRESGAEPVRGREYFDVAQWGDLILGIVDRFS
jgi:hypothetical protein